MKTAGKYILDENGNPVPEDDLFKWADWFENATNRRVAFDEVNGVDVSTMFLGIDHNFSGVGPPLIYETMIFGGKHDGRLIRASTKEEALKDHQELLKLAKNETEAKE